MAFSVSYIYKIVDKYSKPLRNKVTKETIRFRKALHKAKLGVARFAGMMTGKFILAVGMGALAIKRFIPIAIAAASAISGISIGLSVLSFAALINGFSKSTEATARLAKGIGLTIGEYLRLEYAAEQLGIPQDRLSASMRALNKNLGEMKAGRGTIVEYLKKTNPGLLKQLKTTDGMKDSFNLIMTAMRKMKDPAQRAAFAQAMFTEVGLQMATMAGSSAEQVQLLGAELERLRPTKIKEMAVAAAQLHEGALTDFRTALGGVGDVISSKLLPYITPLIQQLTEFIAANRDMVGEKFGEAFDLLARRLEETNLEQWFADASEWIEKFDVSSLVNGMNDAADALAAFGKAMKFVIDNWEVFLGLFVASKIAKIALGMRQLKLALGVGSGALDGLGSDAADSGGGKPKTPGKPRGGGKLAVAAAAASKLATRALPYLLAITPTAANLGEQDSIRRLNEFHDRRRRNLDTLLSPQSEYFRSEKFKRDQKSMMDAGPDGAGGLPLWAGAESQISQKELADGILGFINAQASNIKGEITIKVPPGVEAEASISTDDGMPVGTNINSQ